VWSGDLGLGLLTVVVLSVVGVAVLLILAIVVFGFVMVSRAGRRPDTFRTATVMPQSER